MFSKGGHVIGDYSLAQELQAGRQRQFPIVPERPYAELRKAQPPMASFRQPSHKRLVQRMGLR